MSNMAIFDGILPKVQRSAYDVFAHADFTLLEPFVKQVEDWSKSVPRDASTPSARNQIKSDAFRVAKLKSALEKIGLDESRSAKEIPKLIDTNRRTLKERLESIQLEVRQPLTDWEQEQERLQAEIDAYLDDFTAIAENINPSHSGSIQEALLALTEHHNAKPESLTESASVEAAKLFKEKAQHLTDLLTLARQKEADAAELEKLRAEAAERKRLEEIETAKREAEEKARLEAQAETEQKLEAERLRLREIELQQQRERDAHEQALRDAQQAKLQAEQQAKDALIRAEQEKLAAVEAERLRIEQEKHQAEAAAKAREANRAHCRKINNEVLTDLVATGLTKDQAVAVITAIAKNLIRHTSIHY